MTIKVALLNAFIVILYFTLYLWFFWNVSGGDIALIFTSGLSVLIQAIIILITFFRNKRKLVRAFIGLGIGLLTCIFAFKIIGYIKERTKPNIETADTKYEQKFYCSQTLDNL